MAVGRADAGAKSFELVATRGSETYGICSTPFLEYAFRTVEYQIKVTINPDGTWSYDEDTVLMIRGKTEPFHHTDRNTLSKIGEPRPTRWPESRLHRLAGMRYATPATRPDWVIERLHA